MPNKNNQKSFSTRAKGGFLKQPPPDNKEEKPNKFQQLMEIANEYGFFRNQDGSVFIKITDDDKKKKYKCTIIRIPTLVKKEIFMYT